MGEGMGRKEKHEEEEGGVRKRKRWRDGVGLCVIYTHKAVCVCGGFVCFQFNCFRESYSSLPGILQTILLLRFAHLFFGYQPPTSIVTKKRELSHSFKG